MALTEPFILMTFAAIYALFQPMGIAHFIFLFLIFIGTAANASGITGCLGAKFSAPSVVANPFGSTILITHPSGAFDFSRSAKVGMDRLVAFGKASGMTTVYLQNSNLADVYASDCVPDYWVSSQAGEFSFLLSPENVYFGGGYWEACQDSTFSDVIRSWAITQPTTARLVQIMDAIYVSGTYVYAWDEFYPRYQALLARKSSVGFSDQPTMTLSELMSIMRNEMQQIEVLMRNLPNFGYLPSNFEVQLFFKGRFVQQLKPASAAFNQKLLKIEFLDTSP